MFTLYDDQRQVLIRLGLMISVGAAAVLPYTLEPTSLAASADPARPSTSVDLPQAPGRMEFPSFSISRDPFIPDESVLMRDGIGNDLKASHDASQSRTLLPSVRAVVTGDQARALIDSAGTVRILAIGDHVGDETITAIDGTGVTLSSGLRLTLVTPR